MGPQEPPLVPGRRGPIPGSATGQTCNCRKHSCLSFPICQMERLMSSRWLVCCVRDSITNTWWHLGAGSPLPQEASPGSSTGAQGGEEGPVCRAPPNAKETSSLFANRKHSARGPLCRSHPYAGAERSSWRMPLSLGLLGWLCPPTRHRGPRPAHAPAGCR